MKKKYSIAIIGLGYVGLPLAVEFAKKYRTIGFDINKQRVSELNNYIDDTLEVSTEDLKYVLSQKNNSKNGLKITDNNNEINNCNVFIITVPTPIDSNKKPNLKPLFSASKIVAELIKVNDIVIYESTVYPGLTEEECVPVLEKYSDLKFNEDFFVGYSPERINPGDKEKTLTKILKITSGSTPKCSVEVDKLYSSIVDAGTYLAPSIKVAEAAKVIENSQRDINIAFVNELSKIFNLLEIDTHEVLKAAQTKWNFLPFKPGLVGGHCIGVDPYYLAQKSQQLGYHPEIILTGRRINDSMGKYVANQLIKSMAKKNIMINNSEVLILGITFKENCPDIRNTKVIDIINGLEEFGVNVCCYDPWINSSNVNKQFGIKVYSKLPNKKFDSILLAVAHNEFLDIDLNNLSKNNCVIYDVKGVIPNKSNAKL